jgi:tRNA(His) 5'-end guanylyltransferase
MSSDNTALDGRAFHTYTKNAQKPFEPELMYAFRKVTEDLMGDIGGAVLGYTQSDEISLLLWDAKSITTEPFLGGNVQKLVSLAASMTTALWAVNYHGPMRRYTLVPTFDARVFTIPDPTEVANYFLWRQRDCIRNARIAWAHKILGHKAIQGLSSEQAVIAAEAASGARFDLSHPQFRHGLTHVRSLSGLNRTVTNLHNWMSWRLLIPDYPKDNSAEEE